MPPDVDIPGLDPEFASLRDAFASSPVQRRMAEVIAGGSAQAESQARRHHFVPAMVLRHFGSTSDGRIFQLDLSRGAPRSVRIDEAASRRNLYTLLDEDGTQHRRLETWLSEVESFAANAMRSLVDNVETFTRAEAATLSYFFAMLLVRTPAGTAAEAVLADQAMRIQLACKFTDAEQFTDDGVFDGELQMQALKQLRDGSIAFPDPKIVGLRRGFGRIGNDAQLIYQLRWTVLVSDAAGFVTSDRGLAMVDPSPRWPWTGNGLASSPHAKTYIPISSSECLLLEPQEPRGSRFKRAATPREVDAINLAVLGWTDRHLFGRDQATLDRVRRLAKESPRRVAHPLPVRNVLTCAARPDSRWALENRRRGWPSRVVVEGAPHDYPVLEPTESPVDVLIEMMEAGRTAGSGPARIGTIETPLSADW